jgi:hypothetical protein
VFAGLTRLAGFLVIALAGPPGLGGATVLLTVGAGAVAGAFLVVFVVAEDAEDIDADAE